MYKSIFLSIISLGAIFVALVIFAPEESYDRYDNNVSETEAPLIEEVFTDNNVSTVSAEEPGAKDEEFYDVIRVVDGDTVRISRNDKEETLRLIGMNTPETVDPRTTVECFGKEASNKAKELLSGKRVRLEFDEGQGMLDKYQRTLVYIYTEDGVMFNEWMIKNGYAYEYTYDEAYKYQAEFKAAEKYARENEMGLWSSKTCSGKK